VVDTSAYVDLRGTYVCNTFTPQIKGIPGDTFAMYTSTQEMYPRKVVALLKEQATFIKARIALKWMRCLSLFL